MIPQFEPLITSDYAKSVYDQVLSGWVGSGAKVTEFEDAFAEYIGRKFAVACTSGTAALMISMWSMGLKPGDKIFIPDYSFPAALQAARLINLQPILIDVEPEHMSMSHNAFKESIKKHPDTKAVIYIAHNGYTSRDMRLIKAECNVRAIMFIEDSACGLGCYDDYRNPCGTNGTISIFSFSVPKLITTGQGGMIVCDNEYLMEKCREIVDQGSLTWRKDGIHTNPGGNFKFTDIQAALGLAQLNNIQSLLNKRFNIMVRYMKNDIKLCSLQNFTSPWMMVIQSDKAEEIMKALKDGGYQSKMLYRPAHHSFNPDNREFPNTEKVWKTTLYLPSSLSLKLDQIDEICDIINRVEPQKPLC